MMMHGLANFKFLKFNNIVLPIVSTCNGPGSSVGTATGYGLYGPGDRIPMEVRFFERVQTGPVAHLASCTMGTGSFPG